ncbi:uncharacterized protein LOC112097373 [Citrus clementina]|uniref:uncharacterized protein LOC112097373 n=1 Tax=Citrus clementina TaxID=85681 RepID=UPI000CED12A4|nr:uncharacterized protein LOC112097373 [Citrus x clementina]
MKILSWNIRGLGNPRMYPALKKILQMHGPHLVFLCETKLKTRQMNEVSRKLNYENCFAVSSIGKGGGLALLWNSETKVQIKSFNKHHIDAEIEMENGKLTRCTGVYGHPDTRQRKHTWTLLRQLSDISYKGYPYTWSNGRFGPAFVEERLDRFVCNNAWRDVFSDGAATNIDSWTSDHCPVVMEVQVRGSGMNFNQRRATLIHYEDMWSPYDTCKEIIEKEWSLQGCWNAVNPVSMFQKVSKNSMARLILWSKEEFRGRQKKLEKLMNQLRSLKLSRVQYVKGNKIKEVERQIQYMLADDEIYWKQRSRADWLKGGDKNTKFFHHKASSRKKKNRIWGIENAAGNWIENAEGVEFEFNKYFTNLFTTSKPNQDQIAAALSGISRRVSTEMNESLEMPFTPEEVVEALTQMCPTKAPGPDGLPAVFFQKHWQRVKQGVLSTCLHILNKQGDVAPFNHTYIVLISKKGKPRKVTDFRPISLCNVIYRIVAKAIANRLKNVLPNLISPMQSAFIPNWLITDNIIVGYECLHKIRHCKGRKNGLVALKLDVSKAYDKLEWVFLEQTMKSLGFSQNWVSLIMSLLLSSPKAEHQRLIHGLFFGNELKISHLLFADDSLVFTRASDTDCQNLKKIFDCYSATSGQLFNFEKSSMFLNGNISAGQASKIKEIFQLNIVSRHEKYLGLPSMIGRKRSSFFNDIKLKIHNKVSNWQHKFFSAGGKEVLIKAATQAIPAYAMSVFKIPMGICDDIQRIIANFWWGYRNDKKAIHWSRWNKLSQAKCRGGMGFRDFTSFNQALVAKQGWRILQFPDSLVAKILQARYFQHKDFMNARLGSNPSFIWRSILWGRQVISKGSKWRIGNGQSIMLHKENWLPRPLTFKPISKPSLPADALVAELINEDHTWNEGLIHRHFTKIDAEAIVRILLPRRPMKDEVIWHYDKKGQYSVKSGYQIALNLKFPAKPTSSATTENQWNAIWLLTLPEKIRIFAWRAAKNLLPSAENLWKRKVLQEPLCQFCNKKLETIFHALVGCKVVQKIWKITRFEDDLKDSVEQDMLSLLIELKLRRSKDDIELLVTILWMIWNARNNWIFKGVNDIPHVTVSKAEAVLEAFRRTQLPAATHIDIQSSSKLKAWKPPQRGYFKVNVDAATNLEKQIAGLGAVIRDEAGNVIAAAVKVSKFYGDVFIAEAEAIE